MPNQQKSDMYDPFAPRVNGKPVVSWLSVRDPKAHAEIKKPVARAYSLSELKEYEPLVDDMIVKFMDRLEDFSKDKNPEPCDMAVWLRLCRFSVHGPSFALTSSDAFDVIMHLTFSDSLGFLEAGGDIGDFMVSLDRNSDKSGLVEVLNIEAEDVADILFS